MNRERKARVERLTHETQILVELDLDGIGIVEVSTGVPFFDHMLAQLGKHGGLDLTARAKGDVEIDAHHTVEDTSIAVGQALREALGDKSGITRLGDSLVPLEETLVKAAVDLSGRHYLFQPRGQARNRPGQWPGTVERLPAPVLPHMGWNTVSPPAGSALFAGIGPNTRFYFVHSYGLRYARATRLRESSAHKTRATHRPP